LRYTAPPACAVRLCLLTASLIKQLGMVGKCSTAQTYWSVCLYKRMDSRTLVHAVRSPPLGMVANYTRTNNQETEQVYWQAMG
jgi:hypothetical protein